MFGHALGVEPVRAQASGGRLRGEERSDEPYERCAKRDAATPAGGTRPRRVELGFNRYQFALRIWMG